MTPRQADRAVDIFTLLVVGSVGIALAGLTWRLAGMRSVQTPPMPAAAAPITVAVDVGPALTLAPFGRVSGDSAQPTSLPLQLRGVMLAVPRAASSAMISAPGGAPVTYIVGQAVPGGATVETIELDRVLLRVNGRLERLDLQSVSVASASPAPSTASSMPPPPPSGVPATGPSDGSGIQAMQPIVAAPPPPPSPGAGPSAGNVLPTLLEGLGATPSPEGYRVGVEATANSRRAGFEPGDLIERINGYPASAVANNRQLMAAAAATGSVQVDVRRGDRRVSLTIPLR
jgi:general secretion pathway protein C